MFFGKKNKEKEKITKCSSCNSKITEEFSYCPYCGHSLLDNQEKLAKHGLLGNHDGFDQAFEKDFGFMDKMFSSLIQNVVKNLDKQIVKDLENANITNTPNGIRIQIGQPPKKKHTNHPKVVKRELTEEQMDRIASLPRKQAETQIKRLGNKVVYELATPGVADTEDVFVSKLESGYEVKALGEKKMYVNTLPINLPIKSVMLEKNKIIVEFLEHQ